MAYHSHEKVLDSLKKKIQKDGVEIEEGSRLLAEKDLELSAIKSSVAYKAFSYLNLLYRAVEVFRTQGASVFFWKTRRAWERYVVHPLVRRMMRPLARRKLKQILVKYSDRRVVVFRPIIGWNLHLFQRPQQMALQLANRGYLYFYCFPVNNRDKTWTFKEVADGCFVTPHFELLEGLENKILHLYSTDNICTKEWVVDRLGHGDKVVYEYVDEISDDIPGFPIPGYVFEKHQYILRNEEIACVATADKLYDEVAAVRDGNCALITNGVDVEHFKVERDADQVPGGLSRLLVKRKPIIGYFGALAKWFDYNLVLEVAKRRPGCEILLLGPDYDGSITSHEIEKIENVTYLGTIDYKQLPKYACWFDVAIIPFEINEVTESTSPIKLFEYMALGHPIVTTDMPECRKYQSVLIGKSPDHFIEQLDVALRMANDPAYVSLLREEAEQNSWSSKCDALVRLLDG